MKNGLDLLAIAMIVIPATLTYLIGYYQGRQSRHQSK